MKTILVSAEQSEAGAAFLNEAAALALARGAHLVALVAGVQPSPPFAALPDVPLDPYFEDMRAIRADVEAAVSWVNERLAGTGASFEARGLVAPAGMGGPAFARQARYADLAVFARSTQTDLWRELWDATLFESGKPVLLSPADARLSDLGRRVVIGWDTSAEAARAVSAALGVVAADADVRVAVVDARVGPGAHGEEPGADLATMLSRHGLEVSVDALSRGDGSVADALMRHARAIDADLVITGAYGHSRLSEILLGGVTRDLLDRADRPLLMTH